MHTTILHVLQAETTRRRELEQQLKLTKMQLVGVAAAAVPGEHFQIHLSPNFCPSPSITWSWGLLGPAYPKSFSYYRSCWWSLFGICTHQLARLDTPNHSDVEVLVPCTQSGLTLQWYLPAYAIADI
jgi:hypothetical protein